jgi:hypothetical protein
MPKFEFEGSEVHCAMLGAFVHALAVGVPSRGESVPVPPPPVTFNPFGMQGVALPPPPPSVEPAPPDPEPVPDVFDSAGTVWDARIHASNGAVKQDGTFRRKAKVHDDEYARVMAENRPRFQSTAVPPPPPPATGQQTLPLGTPAPPPPPPTPPGTVDAASVVKRAADAIQNGTLAREKWEALLNSVGVDKAAALFSAPHLVANVAALLDMHFAGAA